MAVVGSYTSKSVERAVHITMEISILWAYLQSVPQKFHFISILDIIKKNPGQLFTISMKMSIFDQFPCLFQPWKKNK